MMINRHSNNSGGPCLRVFSPTTDDSTWASSYLSEESEQAEQQVAGRNTNLSERRTTISQTSLTNPVGRVIKRLIDVCLSLPIVLVAFPPLAVAVLIGHRLQSPGPLFFRQQRCGQHQRKFVILKFRTMNVPSNQTSEVTSDPEQRIFPFGRMLRNTKLDEVPQFLNVLLGSMSIVGPRPHHFEDCQKFEKAVKDYAQRTIAKPGITGLAQFTEYRGDFEWNCVESRVDKDLDYIRRWSILLDLSLIFKTAAVIVAKTLGLSPAIPSPTRADTIIPIPSLVNSNVNSEQNQRDEHERRAA